MTILMVMQLARSDLPPAMAGFDLRDVPATAAMTGYRDEPVRLDDIVVCATDRKAPFEENAYPEERLFPRAETAVGRNARLSLDAEQVELLRGEISQRAMIRLRIPF